VFDYHALLPEIILAATLLAVLGVDLAVAPRHRWVAGVVGLVGLVAAGLPLLTLAGCGGLFSCAPEPRVLFGGAYVVDDFALVLKGLFLVAGAIVLLLSVGYLRRGRYYEGEYYFLVLASVTGAVVMASSRDLITIFVGLELVSAPAFLLAGWRKGDLRSNEAALKFFLIGVLSSAILLFGMSLVYGTTGVTTFSGIAASSAALAREPAFVLGVLFVLVGFGFKVAAVPFHFWAPDTYQGAPIPVAAYLSVGSKGAGFVGLLTMCYAAFPGARSLWGPALWILAALTMTVGNLIALRQNNVVRLLGYSSVAHAGFMLVPFAMAASFQGAALGDAFFGSLTYLIIYAFMNLGAFASVVAIAARTGSTEIDDWAGLARYAPGQATLLGVFFFSLAGIPPLAGWFAKFVMFRAVLGDSGNTWGVVLAVVAAVNAVIALFFYARVLKVAFMDPAPDPVPAGLGVGPPLAVALGITAAVVLAAGFYPEMLAFFGEAGRHLLALP
jgi:NADH-quinone oxidoreductase subunit N